MADRLSKPQQIVRAADEHAAEPPLPAAVGIGRRRSIRRESFPHSHKFRAVTAMLVGLAIAAVAIALVILANGSTRGSTAKWSSWSPIDNGTLGAREIADHLAPFYRISAVDQLAVVTVVNLNAAASAASASSTGSTGSNSGPQVAVRSDPSSSQVSLLSGNTIAYNLCGIGGANCAIGTGQPSADRLLLLRREALELALYTFRYISGVQNVVAILPPGHTQLTSTLSPKPPSQNATGTSKPVNIAVLFLHDELRPWLSHPLSDTFPEQFPPTAPQLSLWRQTPEAGLVDQITAHGLFSERLVQAQDGSNLLVLDPLPPQ
jgi:hypothetical protein